MCWCRLQIVMQRMRSGDLSANAASLDCIACDSPYDQQRFSNIKAHSYWFHYHRQEYRVRNQFLMCWKSFEFDEVSPNARNELYDAREAQFASLEPPLLLSMRTQPVYTYH